MTERARSFRFSPPHARDGSSDPAEREGRRYPRPRALHGTQTTYDNTIEEYCSSIPTARSTRSNRLFTMLSKTGRRGDNPLQLSALPYRPVSAPALPLLMPLFSTGRPLSRKHPWHHHPLSPPQAPPFHPSNTPETTRLNSPFSCISKYRTARYIHRRRTNPSCSASTPSTPPASTLHCSVSRATLLGDGLARALRRGWSGCVDGGVVRKS